MTDDLETKITLLDHGFIRLVSFTQPVPTYVNVQTIDGVKRMIDPQLGWTADLEVVRNARTSFNADWRTGKDGNKDRRLIEHMLLSQHTSPFESVHFTFEVMAPIFVFKQWHRHRVWAYNEMSARYTELAETFYVPDIAHISGQHDRDKQMRSDVALPEEIARSMAAAMREQNDQAFRLYRDLLKGGMTRELARTVLPFATYSRMFGTVSLGNLLKFLVLQMDHHAQYEIRVYANAMRELIKQICPCTVQTFDTSFKVQQFVQQCIDLARLESEEPIDIKYILREMRDKIPEILEMTS